VENGDGCLPIHVAARYASFAVVKVLVDARPQTLEYVSGNRGRHPLHIAARHSSSTDVVKFLVFRCPRVLYMVTPECELPADLAWRSGKNDDANWLEAAMKDRKWRAFAMGPPATALQLPSCIEETGPAANAAPPPPSSSRRAEFVLPATLQSSGQLGTSPTARTGPAVIAAPPPPSSSRRAEFVLPATLQSGQLGTSPTARSRRRPVDRPKHEDGTVASMYSTVTTPMANPRNVVSPDEAVWLRRDDNGAYQLQQELRIAQELIQLLEKRCHRQRKELDSLRDPNENDVSVATETVPPEQPPLPPPRLDVNNPGATASAESSPASSPTDDPALASAGTPRAPGGRWAGLHWLRWLLPESSPPPEQPLR
jgi:Ankyrin repeats (3 copies)